MKKYKNTFCSKKYYKKYYEHNKEYYKKNSKKYYQKNRNQIISKVKKYYQKNKEKIKKLARLYRQTYKGTLYKPRYSAYSLKYYYAHRTELLEKRKKWKKNNRIKLAFFQRQYRYRKKTTGAHTFEEWENLKTQYNQICPACKKQEPQIKLTVDHIIPIVKGGSNNIENIQPLCGLCNSKKFTKTIKYSLDDLSN